MPNQWRVPDLFRESGIRISPERLNKLKMFHVELLKFNERINLISAASAEDSDIIHIWDAVLASTLGRKWLENRSIVDLGSGNGVPGVVMAILNEDIQFTSLDIDERKSAFLRHIRHALKLSNYKVVTGDISKLVFEAPTFVSRGLGSLVTHALLLEKNASLNGKEIEICCMKGPKAQEEIQELTLEKGSTWNTKKLCDYSLVVGSTIRDHQLIILSRHS